MSETTRVPAKIGKSKRWVPKKWDPMYDQWVALRVGGWSNKRIGDQFGYTDQQVSNVLNTPEAKALLEVASKQIRKRLGEDVVTRMANLENRALKNVEDALTNEDLFLKHPLAVADRSMAFLKGMGKLADPEAKEKVINNNTLIVPSELIEKMVDGMDKANDALMKFGNTEVRRLPSGRSDGEVTKGSS